MTMLGAVDRVSIPLPYYWKEVSKDVGGCLYAWNWNETFMTS